MTASRLNIRKKNIAKLWLILCLTLTLCGLAQARQEKSAPAKGSLTGRYEGSAKNNAGDVITVNLDLVEKDGTFSGMINSSHGDFPITGGSHKAEAVTLEFDAGGPVGSLSLRLNDDRLVGTWNAGEDGGPVDVKKVVAKEAPKDKP